MKIGLGFVFFGIALILGQKAHASTIHDLVKTGENASVSAFLSEHPGSWNQRDEYGWLPMHWAVARGQKEIIRSLLSLDGASLSIHDKENPVGLSPFEVAVGLRQVSIAILLEPVYKPRPDEADHPAFAIDTSTRTSNLFLVHTLPGLSPDGVLKADLATDIQVKPYAWHGLGRYQGPVPGDEEFNSREPLGITPPWLASIHFTLNRVIHHERYTSPFAAGGADRAFTVVIPFRAHEGESEDPIRRITSISFSEVVLVGDYPIPMGSVILVRKDRIDEVPEAVREKCWVVPYEDPVYVEARQHHRPVGFDERSKIETQTAARKTGVTRALLALLGAKPLPEIYATSALYVSVQDADGSQINQLDFFRKIGVHPLASFGAGERDHPSSPGQQWRVQRVKAHTDTAWHGEVGFSPDQWHSRRVMDWIHALGLPPAAILQFERVWVGNRVARKAMDLIYDHFGCRSLAQKYLWHVLRSQRWKIPKISPEDEEAILQAAQEMVDVARLTSWPACVSVELGDQLASPEQLGENLLNTTSNMDPSEASEFFRAYEEGSALLRRHPPPVRAQVMNQVRRSFTIRYILLPGRALPLPEYRDILRTFLRTSEAAFSPSELGKTGEIQEFMMSLMQNALSTDGSRVILDFVTSAPGKIEEYLRL